MRVLVIGGTRFIGPCVVGRLSGAGHEVVVFHRGQTRAELPVGVRTFLGDRTRIAEHADTLRGFAPEIVVDMMAMTEDDARGLLETFRGVARRSVVASSGDVYRAFGVCLGLEPGPVEPVSLIEEAPLRRSLYIARSQAKGPDDRLHDYEKIHVERAVLGDPELPGTVLRLPMVHGPGDPYHRLYPYVRRMVDGRPAILLDEALARWRCPRGYVVDVAEAIALAVENDRAAGRVYNVSDPDAPTEAEWVRAIGRAVGWDGEVVAAPRGKLPSAPPPGFRPGQDVYYDTTRVRAELGYREPSPRLEALAATAAWERAHPPEGADVDYAAEDAVLAEVLSRKSRPNDRKE
jgi:nucleoside-diphosphate-sugar epimerase